MLHDLIQENRELLLARSAQLSTLSGGHSQSQIAVLGRVCVFLDQLNERLRAEHGSQRAPSGVRGQVSSPTIAAQMSESAARHGRELRDAQLTIEELVRNYGSLCQAITGYAMEVNATIEVAEFRTLNLCLDEAIAQAVVAFTAPAPPDADSLKAARIKHDARLDGIAMQAFHIERIAQALAVVRTGRVGLDGATGTLLDASLNALRDLVFQEVDQRI